MRHLFNIVFVMFLCSTLFPFCYCSELLEKKYNRLKKKKVFSQSVKVVYVLSVLQFIGFRSKPFICWASEWFFLSRKDKRQKKKEKNTKDKKMVQKGKQENYS